MIQKILGRCVEQGASRHFSATGDFDQTPVENRLHDPVDGDSTHGLDVGARDRLAVGDDGEGFQRGYAQACRLCLGIQGPEPRGEPWRAAEQPTGRCFPDLVGAPRGGNLGAKLLESLPDIGLSDLQESGGHGIGFGCSCTLEVCRQLLGGDSLLRCKKDRLEHVR